jgi:hypothetical protein
MEQQHGSCLKYTYKFLFSFWWLNYETKHFSMKWYAAHYKISVLHLHAHYEKAIIVCFLMLVSCETVTCLTKEIKCNYIHFLSCSFMWRSFIVCCVCYFYRNFPISEVISLYQPQKLVWFWIKRTSDSFHTKKTMNSVNDKCGVTTPPSCVDGEKPTNKRTANCAVTSLLWYHTHLFGLFWFYVIKSRERT